MPTTAKTNHSIDVLRQAIADIAKAARDHAHVPGYRSSLVDAMDAVLENLRRNRLLADYEI